MRLIRWGEARAMPWKNGGGVTHEIAARPEGAGLDGFDWRISMAEVAADGPFSRFEGIDRTLCLVDGAGIVLSFTGSEAVIDPGAEPFGFPGDVAVAGRLIDGPILDLNVMTRRGVASHGVTRITVAGQVPLSGKGIAAIVCRDGRVRVSGTDIELGARDCLLLAPGAPSAMVEGGGTVFVVTFA